MNRQNVDLSDKRLDMWNDKNASGMTRMQVESHEYTFIM